MKLIIHDDAARALGLDDQGLLREQRWKPITGVSGFAFDLDNRELNELRSWALDAHDNLSHVTPRERRSLASLVKKIDCLLKVFE